ncbi:MAG: ATP-dependent zinc metalloprotease FtsH [Bacilli bacterium]|nr:ATP-dependent zinc metalloprotease FtsH [Bacilli bacterium]
MNKNSIRKTLIPYLIILVVVASVFLFADIFDRKVNVLTYDELITNINSGVVDKITITPNDNAGIYKITGTQKGYAANETFSVSVPLSDEVVAKLLSLQEEYNYKLITKEDPNASAIFGYIINIATLAILLGGAWFILTRQSGAANKSMDFGRSRAHLSNNQNRVTFNDVAGLTEEKEEVAELIDFLKDPSRFQKMGARIPKGVLLVGPPGTGKTLLARAVAGEANVPFYFISGSEFVELFVGVGASRVRDMFKQAKQSAPCLIFIEEIDAVGRQRGTGLGGGHDEREQTLNQLLTEMDGFGANEGIIIIAATNRPDVLDPALLRPGRFDRQVQVNLPDAKGREEILKVHAKGKKFASSVSLSNIATRSVGFSGADLENLLNEAALLTVRRGKKLITMAEIDEAHDRVLMGPAKVTKKYTENDKKLVAYHEAGHAVIGIKLSHANVVQKITIIPRGQAGGYNLMLPKEERFTATENELLERITGLLGGRVAEELTFGEVTTGAQNDFEQATKIARAMVTEYGMSDLGPVQYESNDGSVFLGRDYNKSKNFSSQVAFEIDQEIRKIIDKCYKKAHKILKENTDLLSLIANTLITKETLTKEEIDYLVEHGKLPEEVKEVSLEDLDLEDLKEMAKEKKIKGYTKMTKEELIKELKD